MAQAANHVEQLAQRRRRSDLVLAGPAHRARERDGARARWHVDPQTLLDERVLREITAQLKGEQVDLTLAAASRERDVAHATARGDAAGLEDDVVHAAGRGGLHGARAVDFPRHGHLERARRHDGEGRVGESKHVARARGHLAMRLEQRQPGDRNGAERWHVDRAFEVDDRLLADHLQTAGDLNVQKVSGSETIVRPRGHSPWPRRCRGWGGGRADNGRRRLLLLRSGRSLSNPQTGPQ